VTGGGWLKMERVLGNSLDAVADAPKPGRIFEIILSYGDIDLDESYRVFNMGVGLILTSPPDRVEQLLSPAGRIGFRSWVLGRITEGTGSVRIRLGWRCGESIEI